MAYRTSSCLKPSLGILVAALLATSPALAADLDPGYADVPPPIPQQQVTFGSGWYVRGDIAATREYKVDVYQPPNSQSTYSGIDQTSKLGYDLSLGGGYSLTNGVRADVVADFHQPATAINYAAYCYNSASQTCETNGSFRSYDALINGYYDIGTWSGLTPYVGAGVGVAFGLVQNTLTGGTTTYYAHQGYHNLAWALMAGVAFDVYNHVKLDIGYRYLDNGTVYGTKVRFNEVRAGLRYMIDN